MGYSRISIFYQKQKRSIILCININVGPCCREWCREVDKERVRPNIFPETPELSQKGEDVKLNGKFENSPFHYKVRAKFRYST